MPKAANSVLFAGPAIDGSWITRSDLPVSMLNRQTPARSVSAMRTKLSLLRRRVMPLSKSAEGTLPIFLIWGGVEIVPLGKMTKSRMSTE